MNALRFASDHTVRAILIALCDDSEVCNKALDYLSQLEPNAVKIAKELPQMNLKRKSTGMSICVQCEEAFDEAHNTAKDCQYHNGELEPDYDSDFWADHDENCHGIIDSDFCRKEYPEGFVWTCCDRVGTEDGCEFGRHESDPKRNKRHRDDDSASETSSTDDGAPGESREESAESAGELEEGSQTADDES
ncbi:hypothetical protein B0T24DRAFT_627174 [Lasiosphaeria ovina]|uniref:C2H2-type domain-containing protein n=1 Tax=Lasiosphaeria ovina TaxID=92902 RepID=A0AAE0K681_9PEZI|nr:hypothetical protein B0T24DRAFT_627174 [Lasiosphaeria ovina]